MSIPQDGEPVEYRLVPGEPDFLAGSNGTVWRRLATERKKDGYINVKLRGKTVGLHRLVLAAFAGEAPEGMQGCHNDGNRNNNRADNLRWGTPAENMADRQKHGHTLNGIRNHKAKLTEADIATIKALRRQGFSYVQIGKQFGVTEYPIWAIVSGRAWRHVPDPPSEPSGTTNAIEPTD